MSEMPVAATSASALSPTSKDFMSRSYAVVARQTASWCGPQRVARGLSFHHVQKEHLLLGRHLGDIVSVVATRIERPIEGLCRFPQRIAVCGIGWRHGRHRICEIVQDVRKQPIVEMHANGLAYVGGASAVQAERNSGFVEMSVETRRSLECSYIELVRIFERYFGFVGDGLGHGRGHLL